MDNEDFEEGKRIAKVILDGIRVGSRFSGVMIDGLRIQLKSRGLTLSDIDTTEKELEECRRRGSEDARLRDAAKVQQQA